MNRTSLVLSLLCCALLAAMLTNPATVQAQEPQPVQGSATLSEEPVDPRQNQWDTLDRLAEIEAKRTRRVAYTQRRLETVQARIGRVEARVAAFDPQALWDDGYTQEGGTSLSVFHSTILPCESGGEADPFTAVGPTDDWGRAQVNRPVWKSTFEALYGLDFETGIFDPWYNGRMAAYIEDVQGLTAWTCYRRR